jgi:hypothetical protein
LFTSEVQLGDWGSSKPSLARGLGPWVWARALRQTGEGPSIVKFLQKARVACGCEGRGGENGEALMSWHAALGRKTLPLLATHALVALIDR